MECWFAMVDENEKNEIQKESYKLWCSDFKVVIGWWWDVT